MLRNTTDIHDIRGVVVDHNTFHGDLDNERHCLRDWAANPAVGHGSESGRGGILLLTTTHCAGFGT
jgi:hypothetical protein